MVNFSFNIKTGKIVCEIRQKHKGLVHFYWDILSNMHVLGMNSQKDTNMNEDGWYM